MSTELDRLVEVMARLRAECPWTRQQTHESLRPYLLEEAYETLEALDSGDPDHLREELGDLLMQVVIHAAVAEEFDIEDVARGIADKLVHRNPHVFADGTASTPEEVDAAWQRLKAESKQRTSPLDGLPANLPALLFADKVIGRTGPIAVEPISAEDLGEQLFALVARARASGLDPEHALRTTARTHAHP